MTMKILSKLFDYFLEDPLPVLTLLGGSGGLMYWVYIFLDRTRLRITLTREDYYSESGRSRPTLLFEAINVGTGPTSLEPSVSLAGFTPRGKRFRSVLIVDSEDRSLLPHTPKSFRATSHSTTRDALPPLWYKTYTFTPTRGGIKRLRVRSGDLVVLSSWRFAIELALFRFFRKVPNSP